MSYAIYKTEAITLRTIPNGEANVDAVFLTRDLGKISVRVQSARKVESKMRMHLARYGHVVIDVVRGKNTWRLTGITDVKKHALFTDNAILAAFARATGLAEHLIRGEEPHAEIFDFFVGVMDYVDAQAAEKIRSIFSAEALELFMVIHILSKLGYWSAQPPAQLPTHEILENLINHKKELVAQINEAIEATQIV